MFTRLMNTFAPSGTPSVLLVIGNFGTMIYCLHLLPEFEDGPTVERFGTSSKSTTFRDYGATEQAREQIGTVTLYAGDGEHPFSFLDEVETRVRELWRASLSSSPERPKIGSDQMVQFVQDVIRRAALDVIHEKKGRERSMNATQMYPVFVIRVKCSKPGKLVPSGFTSL